MELVLKSLPIKVSQPIQRDLYWYNPIDQLMYHGVGSRLEFKYNKEYKMSFPKVIQEDQWIYENSLPVIKSWVSRHQEQFNLDIESGNRNITINFDVGHWNNIIASLVESKIPFEYDDKQLIKEIKKHKEKS